jgi:urea transporter
MAGVWRTVLVTLRGIGQIMMQDDAPTGLLFVMGLTLSSPSAALAAILGSFCGACAARILRYPRKDIEEGLFGFDAALVVLALSLYQVTVLSATLALAGIAVSVVMTREMMKRGLPPLTAPFVIVTWVNMSVMSFCRYGEPMILYARFVAPTANMVEGVFHGFAQVMFQANTVAGLIFALGVAVCSPGAALRGFLGSALACVIGFLAGWPPESLYAGIIGFNGILTAMFIEPVRQIWPVLAGVALSSTLAMLMMLLHIPPLSAPFVTSAWVIAACRRIR